MYAKSIPNLRNNLVCFFILYILKGGNWFAKREKKKSVTGFYHIMLKGIDDRNIFLDDQDRIVFLGAMAKAKVSGDFEIVCYTLMNNHVHILIKEGEEIGESIKRIAVRYSRFYNAKYGRKGHLLNNRFKSEAVEDEGYLLNVFHYIQQNPIRAGLVEKIELYRWTSYHEYVSFYKDKNTWIDVHLMNNYFEDVMDFTVKSNEMKKSLEIHSKIHGRLEDDQLYLIAKEMTDLIIINKLPKFEKIKIIRKLKEATHSSNRQLARVLGIGRKTIDEACKET